MDSSARNEPTTPSTIVALAIGEAARLSTTALHALDVERARLANAESQKRSMMESLLMQASDARAFERLFKTFLPIPGLRHWLTTSPRREARQATEKADSMLVELDRIRRRMEELESLNASLRHSDEMLVRALRTIPRMGVPPKRVEEQARAAGGVCSSLIRRRRGADWPTASANACQQAVAVMREWARVVVMANQRQANPVAAPPAISKRPARRIYLPIPSVLSSSAKEAGALRDDVGGRGVSPWYVTMDMDLKPFRSMLPLAYRPQNTTFEFPPIPYRASGQNLWSFFDKDTWRRVRSASTASSGQRCMVCGGRGGFISDKVLGPEERRHGVDCHEVWDWEVPDPSTGIGIQSLKKLLVVCPSCHACFHKGYFVHRGRDVGLGDEVAEHVDRRRMLINRMDEDALRASLEASKEALQRAQGIDQWIVDLEHVSRQQFMTDHLPILDERNASGVPAERIAGIAFETASGEHFPARSAAEIHEDLLRMADESHDRPGMR